MLLTRPTLGQVSAICVATICLPACEYLRTQQIERANVA